MRKYIRKKLELLKQFDCRPSKNQKEYMYSLKSEVAVDNFVRTLLKIRFGELMY